MDDFVSLVHRLGGFFGGTVRRVVFMFVFVFVHIFVVCCGFLAVQYRRVIRGWFLDAVVSDSGPARRDFGAVDFGLAERVAVAVESLGGDEVEVALCDKSGFEVCLVDGADEDGDGVAVETGVEVPGRDVGCAVPADGEDGVEVVFGGAVDARDDVRWGGRSADKGELVRPVAGVAGGDELRLEEELAVRRVLALVAAFAPPDENVAVGEGLDAATQTGECAIRPVDAVDDVGGFRTEVDLDEEGGRDVFFSLEFVGSVVQEGDGHVRFVGLDESCVVLFGEGKVLQFNVGVHASNAIHDVAVLAGDDVDGVGKSCREQIVAGFVFIYRVDVDEIPAG